MNTVSKAVPVPHHEDMFCPHCMLAMMINDWLSGMDCREYAKRERAEQGHLVPSFLTDTDIGILGVVSSLAVLSSHLVLMHDNEQLSQMAAHTFTKVYADETQKNVALIKRSQG